MTEKRRTVAVLGSLVSAAVVTALGVGAAEGGTGMRPPDGERGVGAGDRRPEAVVRDDLRSPRISPNAGDVEIRGCSTFWL